MMKLEMGSMVAYICSGFDSSSHGYFFCRFVYISRNCQNVADCEQHRGLEHLFEDFVGYLFVFNRSLVIIVRFFIRGIVSEDRRFE